MTELGLGVPAGSSCFLRPPRPCHRGVSGMQLLSRTRTVSAGSAPSAAPPLPQHGALPPGPLAPSAGPARGSVLGTTWFPLRINTTAQTCRRRKAAGRVVLAWLDKDDREEDAGDITAMRMHGGTVGGSGQVEEEEEEEEGTVGQMSRSHLRLWGSSTLTTWRISLLLARHQFHQRESTTLSSTKITLTPPYHLFSALS